jgi:hypothetical protein
MTSMHKAQYAALLSVSMMFATVGILFYFWFFEAPYLTFKNIPFPPVVTEAHPGDIIPLSIERCSSASKTKNYSTSHSLINVETNVNILLPDVRILIEPGCTSAVSLINRIPPETPPGKYIVIGTADISGTLREYHLDWRSQEFRVLQNR